MTNGTIINLNTDIFVPTPHVHNIKWERWVLYISWYSVAYTIGGEMQAQLLRSINFYFKPNVLKSIHNQCQICVCAIQSDKTKLHQLLSSINYVHCNYMYWYMLNFEIILANHTVGRGMSSKTFVWGCGCWTLKFWLLLYLFLHPPPINIPILHRKTPKFVQIRCF